MKESKELLNEITGLSWLKSWEGKFFPILVTMGVPGYFEAMQEAIGWRLKHFLFTHHTGICTGYWVEEELEEFGRYLAKKAEHNPEIIVQWANRLKKETDYCNNLMKKQPTYFLNSKKFAELRRADEIFSLYQIIVREVINYLPDKLLDKYSSKLEDARRYCEKTFFEFNDLIVAICGLVAQESKYDIKFIVCLTAEELEQYLKDKSLPNKHILEERYLCFGAHQDLISQLLSASDVDKIEKSLVKTNGNQITGKTAYPGIVKGRVRVIKDFSRVMDFVAGDILVTGMTDPNYLPIMRKASAIITDAGGALSHAAIVSREFKIPCIVGTKTATHFLKTGDLIEVNATEGTVKVVTSAQNNSSQPALYKKFLTRSVSLLHCQILYRGEKDGLPKKLGGTLFYNPIAVHHESQAVDTYYDFTDAGQDPMNMVPYLKENANEFFKNADIYEKDCEKMLSLLKNPQVKQFEEIYHLIIRIWPMRILTSMMASYMATKVPNEKIVARSKEVRQKYEKLGYMVSSSLIELAKKKVPKDYVDFVNFLTFEEISGKLPPLETLRKRAQMYIYFDDKVIVDQSVKEFEAKNKISLYDPSIEVKFEETLKGVGVSKGKVRGRVKIIFEPAQMDKVKQGDILVTSMTTPDFLPAMKNASGFITDEGGMLCHAAIVAREMGKPCLASTKVGTKMLKVGDLIELDATKGVVRILNKNGK